MNRQIRRGVFETNSSSTHSMTIMMKDDFDKWMEDPNLYICQYVGRYPNGAKKPVIGTLYTKEEVINFINTLSWNLESGTSYNGSEEDIDEIIAENEFVNRDWDENSYLEYFEETFTTPLGEEIVAFGEYGYDG